MIRLLAIFALAVTSVAADLKSELVKASPRAVRDGCPNVARKLRAGEAVSVVFLGGSITENRAGFSTTVPAWMREKFPAAKIEAVNAGWGGTGSELGAQRLGTEVLPRKPDLVFVEFAVNDIAKPEFSHMERIVRALWTADAETDVVFLYTLNKGDLEFYRKGWFPLSVSRHERAAAHYGVPMIAVAQTVAADVLAGKIAWEDFSNDTCHPHARGYTHYTTAITTALDEFFAAGKPGPHAMPAPLTPGLVVNPPPIAADPQPAPAPMRADDGRNAAKVFELPRLGTQWTATADFKTWRLRWQPVWHSSALDASGGLDRSKWRGGIGWIDEAGFFTGPSHRWLAGGRGDLAGRFGGNSTENAVVTFVAPESGEYLIQVGAEGIGGYSQREKQIGLNVVHFPAGADAGKSLIFFASSRAAMQPLTRHSIAKLAAGDEIALVFLPNQVGGGSFFTGVSARFGLLP